MSVGHAARAFEESGIPTVVVASGVYEVRLKSMQLPRLLLTPYIMGLPLGFPGQADIHRRIVATALTLFDRADGKQPLVENFSA